ncbi:unnamed protein product, partial [Pleuronectes platessa]
MVERSAFACESQLVTIGNKSLKQKLNFGDKFTSPNRQRGLARVVKAMGLLSIGCSARDGFEIPISSATKSLLKRPSVHFKKHKQGQFAYVTANLSPIGNKSLKTGSFEFRRKFTSQMRLAEVVKGHGLYPLCSARVGSNPILVA